MAESQNKFNGFYTVNGNTAVTNEFTTELKSKGMTEVSKEEREFTLAFCRINTRPGIDIQETQDQCPDGKPIILVLLHHTFDPQYCENRGPEIKKGASTILCVDLLYYEDRLLNCPLNERGLKRVLDVVGTPSTEESVKPRFKWFSKSTGGRMRRFYTVNGNTAVTNEFTTELKSKGMTEVSKEEREFTLAFCRINTRPGIDIQETQDQCPDGKPIILVLLHHTFDPQYCENRGPEIKKGASTILCVDLLYYEDRLLNCPLNERGLKRVLDVVGTPSTEEFFTQWLCKGTVAMNNFFSGGKKLIIGST